MSLLQVKMTDLRRGGDEYLLNALEVCQQFNEQNIKFVVGEITRRTAKINFSLHPESSSRGEILISLVATNAVGLDFTFPNELSNIAQHRLVLIVNGRVYRPITDEHVDFLVDVAGPYEEVSLRLAYDPTISLLTKPEQTALSKLESVVRALYAYRITPVTNGIRLTQDPSEYTKWFEEQGGTITLVDYGNAVNVELPNWLLSGELFIFRDSVKDLLTKTFLARSVKITKETLIEHGFDVDQDLLLRLNYESTMSLKY